MEKSYIGIGLGALVVILLLQFFSIYAIFISIPLFLLIWFMGKKELKYFALGLFLIMFLLRIGVVLIFKTPVLSDFKVLFNAAQSLLKGYNVMNSDIYFYRYGYQTGPVLYMYLLLSIKNSLTFLKIINCLFSSFNCVLVYLIAKELTSKKSAQMVSLLYGLLMFPLFFNTVLSNQIPASTCFYLAIFLIIKDSYEIKNYIGAAILLFLGNFMRSEGIVFVCAIIGMYIFYLIYKKANKKMHIGIILLVSLYFILNIGASNIVRITHLNNVGLTNNFTSWKFLLGFNYNTCGTYNDEDVVYMQDKETAKKEIRRRIKNLGFRGSLELISCKANIYWSGGYLDWTFSGLEEHNYKILGFNFSNNDLQNQLNNLNKIFYYTAFGLMIYGLYKYLKNKDKDRRVILLVNILAINFIVYSVIEVQPRYIYLAQIAIFILASLGLENFKKKENKENGK